MDETAHEMLSTLDLQRVRLIRLKDFEDEELLKAKPTRTVAEYCWTCTPSLPLYVLGQDPSIDVITYIDADLFFFENPEPIFREFDARSIMIIGHRYSKHLQYFEVNGIYNVSMVGFRNDADGLACLRWWRERCNEWCYNRLEGDRMGDQKYLDDWPTRFGGVHVLQHMGAGVALWNIMSHHIREQEGRLMVDDVPLIFYHFHQFRLLEDGSSDFGDRGIYRLTDDQVRLIYLPYVKAIADCVSRVRALDPTYSYGFEAPQEISLKERLMRLLPWRIRVLMGSLHSRFVRT